MHQSAPYIVMRAGFRSGFAGEVIPRTYASRLCGIPSFRFRVPGAGGRLGRMRFETTMLLTGNNTGIEVPPEMIDALGAGRTPPVTVTVNGYEYRSTVAVMGGRHLIPFSSDKRAATGIQGGDPIVV